MDEWQKNLPIIRLVLCEVLKPIGYHDVHEVGEVIMIQERHVTEMVNQGIIRVVQEEVIEHEDHGTGQCVRIAQDYWNGVVIRVPKKDL